MLQGPRVREASRHAQDGRCSERSPASSPPWDAGSHGGARVGSLCSFCPFLLGIAITVGTTKPAKGSRTQDQRTMSSFTGENRLFMLVSLRACCIYYGGLAGSVPPWAAELFPQKPA